jgi:phosphoglycolate phosphatase
MAIECISFDLDGTLLDTASEIAEAANRTLDMHGLERKPPAEIALLIGHGGRTLMLKLLARMLLDEPSLADRVRADDVLASFDDNYAMTIGSSSQPYEGAKVALNRLRGYGVRLACTTNKEHRHALRLLQTHGLADAFELVLGGDSLPQKKPHSSVLRHAARLLRVESRNFAHVGDSAVDVEAARNAGIAAWAVPYGFNGGVPIADAKPNRIFGTLTELADYVIGSALVDDAADPNQSQTNRRYA